MRTQVNQSAHDLRSSTCQYLEKSSRLSQYSNLSLFLEKSWPLKTWNVKSWWYLIEYEISRRFLVIIQFSSGSSLLLHLLSHRESSKAKKDKENREKEASEGEFYFQFAFSFDSINGDKRNLSVLFFFFWFYQLGYIEKGASKRRVLFSF